MINPEADRISFSKGASFLIWFALLSSLLLLWMVQSSWGLDLSHSMAAFAALPESALVGAVDPVFYPVIAWSNALCLLTALMSATTWREHLLHMRDRASVPPRFWRLVAIMYALRAVCVIAFAHGGLSGPYQPMLAKHGPAIAILFFPAFNVTLVLALIAACCSLVSPRPRDARE